MRPNDDATTPIDSPWNRPAPRLSPDSPTDERYRSQPAPQFGRTTSFATAPTFAGATQRIDAPWARPNAQVDAMAGLDFTRSPYPATTARRSRTPLFVILGCAALALVLALVGGAQAAIIVGFLLFVGAIGTFVVRFLVGAVRALIRRGGGERRLLGRTGLASLAIGGASLAVMIAGTAMAPPTPTPAPIAAPVPTVSEVATPPAVTPPPVPTAPPTTEPPAPAPVPIAEPVENPPAPEPEAPSDPAPAPAPAEEEPEQPAGVYYENCKAAKADGAAPLHAGQPGYRTELDRDGDGIACET